MAVYGDTRLGSAIEQLIGGNFGRADPQAVGQAQLTRARTDRQNQETLAREMLGNAIISSLETGMTPREMMANIYGRGVQISDGFARAAPGFARGAGLGIYGTDQLGTRMAADLMMGAGDSFSSTELGFQQAEAGRNARAAASGTGAGGQPNSRNLTEAARDRVGRMVRDAGWEGANAARVGGAIIEAWVGGDYGTLDEAAAAILPGVEMRDVQVGTDPNEFFGPNGTWNPLNMFRGPSPIMEEQLYIPGLGDVVSPPSGAPEAAPAEAPRPVEGTGVDANTEAVLQEARTAIERGADAEAVRARLIELGIDPGAL